MPNKTLKNFRNSFLEKSSKRLVNSSGRALNKNGKLLKSRLMFTNKVNRRGQSIRNLLGTNLTTKAGIFSTKKIGKLHLPYTNAPAFQAEALTQENKNAVRYRKITNSWTPQIRNNPRLNETNSKILANVYAASAPNYNFDTMVDAVWARDNIDDAHKMAIRDRLYALYDEENNNSENENDAELRAWAAASEAGRQRIVQAAVQRSQAAQPLPELASLNTIRKKSQPKPSLPAYFAAQAKGMNGI